MIAELVPLDQTRVGLDLIDKGRKEGANATRREFVNKLFASGYSIERISELFQIPVPEVSLLLGETQS